MKRLQKDLVLLLFFLALSHCSQCAVAPRHAGAAPVEAAAYGAIASSALLNLPAASAKEACADAHFGRRILSQKLKKTNKVLLTFDDGPNPKTTPKILQILKERNLKAIFFVIGLQAQKYPELLRQIQREGHIIGNHTFAHKNLNKLSEQEVIKQVEDTNRLVEQITGVRPVFCRPPYGAANKEVLKILAGLNMRSVLWTVDPKDWKLKNDKKIYEEIRRQLGIENGKKHGGVILMHDIYSFSVRALEPVLDMLAANNYRVAAIDKIDSNKDAMWASLSPALLTSAFQSFDIKATGNCLLINGLSKPKKSCSSMGLLKAAKRGRLFVYLFENNFALGGRI